MFELVLFNNDWLAVRREGTNWSPAGATGYWLVARSLTRSQARRALKKVLADGGKVFFSQDTVAWIREVILPEVFVS